MAPFSLWQLLNQRQAFNGDDDPNPAQQRQSAGQAIGQSLIDMWNRADPNAADTGSDEDSNPYLSHLIDYPDAPGRSSFQPQLLPYYPSDQSGYDLVLDSPLAAGNSVSDPNEPRSEGQGAGVADPNIQSAQWQGPAIRIAEELIIKYGPVIGGALAKAWQDAQKNRTEPASPLPFNPPDQTPTSPAPVDPGQDVNPTVPGIGRQTASSTSLDGNAYNAAQPSDAIDALIRHIKHPLADADSLPEYVPGDFSRGLHNQIVNYEMEALRNSGCKVVPNIRFGVVPRSPEAIPDYVRQCFNDPTQTASDVKTGFGDNVSLRKNQKVVYPAMVAGKAYSPSPGIKAFNLPMNRQLGPINVEIPTQNNKGWRTLRLGSDGKLIEPESPRP
jgi:hypothetical protein